jgi:hypothetical protein
MLEDHQIFRFTNSASLDKNEVQMAHFKNYLCKRAVKGGKSINKMTDLSKGEL